MAWEEIEMSNRKGHHGELWNRVPAISVTKSHITFNRCFQETFGVTLTTRMSVLVDRSEKLIGLKLLSPGDIGGFRVRGTGLVSRRKTLFVLAPKIGQAFPSAIGYAYQAKMQSEHRIITVDLKENIDDK